MPSLDKDTEYPKEAVELVKAITSVQIQTKVLESGQGTNNAKAIAKASELDMSPVSQKLLDLALSATGSFGAQDTAFDLTMSSYFIDALNLILSGEASVEDAVAELQEKAETWAAGENS